jgi:CRISPR-associated protein Cas2
MDVVVAYDIATATAKGQRRLRRVAAVCEGYGVRRQFSVFECRISDVQLVRLKQRLVDEIDHVTDSVVFYTLGRDFENARSSIGREVDHDHGAPWVL